MHNAHALHFSADSDVSEPRVVGISTLAAIIGMSLLGSYLLVPDQNQLVERLMRDQQYEKMQGVLRSGLGNVEGLDAREFENMDAAQLATLSQLLRLTPREQLQTVFSPARNLNYDRVMHAVTLSAIRYVDVIPPEQAWRLVAPMSGRIPAPWFSELASLLSRNALAISRPDVAATILAHCTQFTEATPATVAEMVQAFRWSGKPAQAAVHMQSWLKRNPKVLEAPMNSEVTSLLSLGATVALEGGDPSAALDFQLAALSALPEDAAPDESQIESVLSLSGQCSRTTDVVPWLGRFVESLPEAKADWKKLSTLREENPKEVDTYIRWNRVLAQYSDWSSQFDAAFDAHFRLAALGETASLDRCLALCDFLGRGEEMASLLQYSDAAITRPALQARLAALLAAQGRDVEALPLYQHWIAANPDDVEAAHDLGVLLQDMGREDDALKAFENVLKTHPAHIPTVKKLAESCIRAGQHDRALELYKGMADADHDYHTLENFALLAESLDQHQALFRAQVLHARQPDLKTVEPYLNLAETAAYLPSSRPAIQVLEEGLERFPESPALRVALATVWHRDLGDIDKCYATLRHDVVKKSFDGITMLLDLATAVPDQKDLLAFLGPDIENKMELPPRSLLSLAVLSYFCGDTKRCESLFQRIPESPRTLPLIAEARFQMNNVEESIRLMTAYLNGNTRSTSEDWIFLGELYEITGQTDAAAQAYQNSLALLTSDLPATSKTAELKTSDSTASPSQPVITPRNSTLTAP